MSAQLENGHTRIANEIIEAMCKLKISNYESRFLWALFRKTYGFHKKEDKIALSQFSELTNIESHNIARTKTLLLGKKIIYEANKKIGFNKVVSDWIVSNEIVSKQIAGSIQRDTKTVSEQIHTKERKKLIQKIVAQTSKNSLTACTQKELEHIAETKGVDLEEVILLHESILLKIQDGIFQKKGYGKTVYFTLVNWITRDIKEIRKRKKLQREKDFEGVEIV